MDEILADIDTAAATTPATEPELADEYADDELLVEEVSIDGMCGVY